MKKLLVILLVCALLTGCGSGGTSSETVPSSGTSPEVIPETSYVSRFPEETVITLTAGAMNAEGSNHAAVFLSKDIVYYEDRDTYESGNPYGEGEDWERHTLEEAKSHLVLNITRPGAYRVSGAWSAGQIRVDLGEEACDDPNAVVELILEDLDITCTVAPAILFLNVYECDGERTEDNATPYVDTSDAGANLIVAGENKVNGSHVAKIFKDKDGEKKLWKQDGAIYSYMSMNVFGPGKLELTADNEGMDSELHLTINGGDIRIWSGNDGINTNEDGVSVTAINGGSLRISAGLREEGDGIDSNGYLVINGGMVVAAAHPASDAGLDSDMGSFINGGTVVALGSAMDWAESDSGQVTMNLQFAGMQTGDIRIKQEDGTEVFAFEPAGDPVIGLNIRSYQGAIISCAGFRQGDSYQVWVGGTRMAYTGSDVMMGPGGFGGPNISGGNGPDRPDGEMPSMPEGQQPPGGFGGQPGEPPAGFPGGGDGGEMPPVPEGEIPSVPEGEMLPPGGPGGSGGFVNQMDGERKELFYMQDKVNFFSGISRIE